MGDWMGPGRYGEVKILDGIRTLTPRSSSPVASHYTHCVAVALPRILPFPVRIYEYEVIGFVVKPNPSSCTSVLGLTQRLT
jgi:hypothetical protein